MQSGAGANGVDESRTFPRFDWTVLTGYIVGGRIVVTGGLGGEKLKAMATGECISYRGKKFMKLPDMGKERASLTSLNFEGKFAV